MAEPYCDLEERAAEALERNRLRRAGPVVNVCPSCKSGALKLVKRPYQMDVCCVDCGSRVRSVGSKP